VPVALPDAARSYAVLIGVSEFADPELPALPAVRNNLAGLAQVLTSSWSLGLTGDHCTVLADPVDVATVGDRVEQVAEQAEDLLLVYYAGHGLLDAKGELYLSVLGTRRDRLRWTGLAFPASAGGHRRLARA
jgi:uncharacterized caspase-like protein